MRKTDVYRLRSRYPHAPAEETLAQRVERLLATWRAQTGFLSSSTAMVAHPVYLELIALGAAALPFLFHDLEQTRDGHLSSALVAITGEQPVPPEEEGQIRKVAEALAGLGAAARVSPMNLLEQLFPDLCGAGQQHLKRRRATQ